MPRTLKRGAAAISRDISPPASSPEPESSRNRNHRRARSSSASSAVSSNSAEADTQAGTAAQSASETSLQTLAKKLIRLALSCEYARLPLRRSDITQKIFKESNASHRLFKPVFATAQTQLREVFGMELFELPGKEKTSLKDRRTQATQTRTQNTNSTATYGGASGNSNKSWILISILPKPYKTNPTIIRPSKAPTAETEALYTALYTFVLSLIYLNNSALPEAKLERYLKRVNADTYTPIGGLDKVLQRMVKEGYLEKRRDTSLNEEVIEYVIGPRGKVEVGVKGVAGLVRSVYGFGAVPLGIDTVGDDDDEEDDNDGGEDNDNDNDHNHNGDPSSRRTAGENSNKRRKRLIKMEKDELEKRLERSLGIGAKEKTVTGTQNEHGDTVNNEAEDDNNDDDGDNPSNPVQPAVEKRSTRGKVRRRRRDDTDDDDDDDDDDE